MFWEIRAGEEERKSGVTWLGESEGVEVTVMVAWSTSLVPGHKKLRDGIAW